MLEEEIGRDVGGILTKRAFALDDPWMVAIGTVTDDQTRKRCDVIHANHHAWVLLGGCGDLGFESKQLCVLGPAWFSPADIPQQSNQRRTSGEGLLKSLGDALKDLLSGSIPTQNGQSVFSKKVFNFKTVLLEDMTDGLVGLLVTEKHTVIVTLQSGL